MSPLDWIMVSLPLAIVLIAGTFARTYVRGVADFVAANRSAGRYLLSIARGEFQAGAVVFVAYFEIISHAGFTYTWWGWMTIPFATLIGIFGWVTYRYRETRAMTLGQFFEIRYSKRFRLFAGLLGFFAGLLNFGIIPAVGARCLVYFLGLPETVTAFSITMPTFIPLMALLLSITTFVAMSGGLITVMVINSIEGIMAQLFYLVIIGALLWMFRWSQISATLSATPPHQSLLNPFDSSGIQDFNMWLVLIGLFGSFYGTMAWQNASGYNAAGLSAHETRMGGILYSWREAGKNAVIMLLAICALTYLHHPDFAAQAAHVQAKVAQISSEQAREQMVMPIAVAAMLPAGVKGIFCAILLMGVFGGDATHLHSWSGIFVQDFFVPLRSRPFTPRQHLFVLRCAILGVAIFAFLFGASFPQTQYVSMWWSVTMAVFIGGAGSVIIGGLYWKKGTTAGAWSALLTGSLLSLGGIIAQTLYPHQFPLNGAQVGFGASLCSIAVYVSVSLATLREDFNMDRMLHRGAYAVAKPGAPAVAKPKLGWKRIIGIDENFTRGDTWIAIGIFSWTVLLFVLFLTGTLWNLAAPWPTAAWSAFWHVIGIGMPVLFALVTGIWFTWGGLRDMRRLFRRLKDHRDDIRDDGTVLNHQNLDDLSAQKPAASRLETPASREG
jgi:SSS family solute:Na+ symporter